MMNRGCHGMSCDDAHACIMHASCNIHVTWHVTWQLQHNKRSLKNGMKQNRGKMHITEKDTLKIRLDFWHNQPCNIVLHMCVEEYSFNTIWEYKDEAGTQRNTRNTIGNTSFSTSPTLLIRPKQVRWKCFELGKSHPPYGFMATRDGRNRDLRLPPSLKTK